MSESNLVSVVMPTFNYGAFIAEALESLRAQTHEQWECVVVDDGSEDDTRAVVERLIRADPRIRYCRQANQGQAVARNRGASESRGEYFQLLDADDLLQRRKLEEHVNYLRAHPAVDIVYGDVRYFSGDAASPLRFSMRDPDVDWLPRLSGRGRDLAPVLVERNILPINAPLLRMRVVRQVGGFDERMRRLDDWDFWIRCALADVAFQYHAPPDTMALIRAHGSSLTKGSRHLHDSTLQMRGKIEGLATDPRVLEINRAMTAQVLEWTRRVRALHEDLARCVADGSAVILVDEEQLRREMSCAYRFIPFIERSGQYWGPPESDKGAIDELERLRGAGAAFIVFPWVASWWLEHYVAFREHLESRYARVLANDRLIAFDLREPRRARVG